jgi:drug/metabolite transporter (DMT)-like permease
MVIMLGLAAAVLYGTGDFLGGQATRKAGALAVLTLAQTAGVIIALPAAAMSPGPARPAALAWGISAGLIGGAGLILFYQALAAGPMSMAAPVSALVATILPVTVALADGERPGPGVYAGAALCLAAIVLTSSGGQTSPAHRTSTPPRPQAARPGRSLRYATAAGVSFGLYFLLIRNAGQSGELWPVAAGRIGELAAVLIAAAALRRNPLPRGASGRLLLAASGAGTIDVIATISYVAATKTGPFGLAVVLASLYPGITVLLARVMLGERLRWAQRTGLGLATIGIILLAA